MRTKNKLYLIFISYSLAILSLGILLGANLNPKQVIFAPYPERKPFTVTFEDDCYVNHNGKENRLDRISVEDLL